MDDSANGRSRYLVVNLLATTVLNEKASISEPTQVIGGGGRLDLTKIRQFPDRIFSFGKELEHPQTNGMRNGFEAFGCSPQGIPIQDRSLSCRVFRQLIDLIPWDGHIVMCQYVHISEFHSLRHSRGPHDSF